MQGLQNIEIEPLRTEDYNSEPVYYCMHCLSLKIMIVNNFDYCDTCGSTDIAITDIDSWREMYKNKYGKEFLNK